MPRSCSKHSQDTVDSVAHILIKQPEWSHERCAKYLGMTRGQFNGIVHRNNLYRPHRHMPWNPMPQSRVDALKLSKFVRTSERSEGAFNEA